MRRRTLSILAISLTLAASLGALVAVGLAASPTQPNLSRALEAQRRLTTEHPQDAAAFNDLGNLYLLARQPAEAEAAYRKAVELDPKRASSLFNLGLLLQQRGEPKEALGFFRQVLEVQPEHAWAHYQVGALYESWGQESKAVDEYAHAFALDPQLAFPEVNPHVVDNKLITQAMLRAYRSDYGVPFAPAVYEDPHRIADLLVPPPPQQPADAAKDATAAKPAQPAQPGAAAGKAGGVVLREGDLGGRMTGQAGPPGSVRQPQPGIRVPSNVPRGTRQWERPEPTIQYPTEDGRQQMQPPPGPGQVITPPPAGGVYYRPGYQSTGRLNLQVLPDKSDARG